MKQFYRGMLTGVGVALAVIVVVVLIRFFRERDRKIIEAMEAQHEIEVLQEDIGNRSPGEFLEDPGIRGAADNADAEFRRKRNEAIQRIRGGNAD